VVDENHERAYRRAIVEVLADPPVDAADQHAMRELRGRLESFAGLPQLTDPAAKRLVEMPDVDFVHAMATALDLEPLEKQALLEQPTLLMRAHALVDLLDMRRLVRHLPDAPGRLH
jgi:Lon protease-like protein